MGNKKSEIRDQLRNGHAADKQVQGHALAAIIDSLEDLHKALADLPSRSEVREMINNSLDIHLDSCSARMPKADDPTSFKIGKIGLEVRGKAGVYAGVLFGGLVVGGLMWVAPYIATWLRAAK